MSTSPDGPPETSVTAGIATKCLDEGCALHGLSPSVDAPTTTPTTSLTRQFSDIDAWSFYQYVLCLAMCRALMMQPVTLVLTRIRALHRSNGGVSPMGQLRALLRSSMDAAMRRHNTESGAAMVPPWYKGLPAFAVGASLSEACYLFQFECSREWLLRDGLSGSGGGSVIGSWLAKHREAGAHDFVAALFAEATRQVMIIPFTVVATRQVMLASCPLSSIPLPAAASSAVAVGRLLWRERGPRAFYAGLGTSLAIGPVWTASWWWLYAQWKAALYRAADPYLVDDNAAISGCWRSRGDNTMLNTSASIMASAQAAVFFNPFLVVRTRLQAAAGGVRLSQVMQEMMRDGGSSSSPSFLRGLLHARRPLMAGTCLTVVQAVVDGVGASLTYEYAKRWAEQWT